MRTNFNPQRLIQMDIHGETQRYQVTQMTPLSAALAAGQLSPRTAVLYTQLDDTPLAFKTTHLSLYNVMQGENRGQPWMATFCAVCNAGMMFSPVLDGQVYQFYGAGFYDAMVLLADRETGSYWDHITGECIAGTLAGARLERRGLLTHTTAASVAQIDPQAQLALTTLTPNRQALEEIGEVLRTAPQFQWPPEIENSLDWEDRRLPRLEMGLGVWTRRNARYYLFRTLHTQNNVIFDQLEGRRLLVYNDPDTLTPAALFTDATSAIWHTDGLQLDNGQQIQAGGLYKGGEAQPIERPLQLFQRWYGFSLIFPGCEIYRPSGSA
jgi:Protein of unknown function (DUF3179)